MTKSRQVTHTVQIQQDPVDLVWKAKPVRIQPRPPSMKEKLKYKPQKPGDLYVKKGDKVIFEPIGTDVAILVPFEDLFGERDLGIVKNGDTLEVEVDKNLKEDAYPYSVFCFEPWVYAEGGSPPEIIVEP
ncbi:hypothetical protein ACFLU6_10845 [Acidobacteriota bacterium]